MPGTQNWPPPQPSETGLALERVAAAVSEVIKWAERVADDAPPRKRTRTSMNAEVRWASVLMLREALANLKQELEIVP